MHRKPRKKGAGNRKLTLRQQPPPQGAHEALRQVADISRFERQEALSRQEKAGIVPFKPGFRRDLQPPEVAAALLAISEASFLDKQLGFVDQPTGQLYTKINKGLCLLTANDVVWLGQQEPKEIRRLAPLLVKGLTLAQARWGGKEQA